jgi:hypothetical protein
MAALVTASNDFVIWGPSVNSGTVALNAVHAMYYLPQSYKLVLPTASPEEPSYKKVTSLIKHFGLGERVQFSNKQVEASKHAVIARDETDNHQGYISGETPEALASAILNAARAVA